MAFMPISGSFPNCIIKIVSADNNEEQRGIVDLAGNSELEALALTWAHALIGMVMNAADIWTVRRHVTRTTLIRERRPDLGTYADLATALDERNAG